MVESFSKYIQLTSGYRVGSPKTILLGDIKIQGYIGFYDYGVYEGKVRASIGIFTNDPQAQLLSDKTLSIDERPDNRDHSKTVYKLRFKIDPQDVPLQYRFSMDTRKPISPFPFPIMRLYL